MSSDENFKKTASIIATLRDLYDNENWNASLPLKVLKKRVGAYISQLEHDLESLSQNENKHPETAKALPAGYIKIYVMLHQNSGENIKSWNASLLSLTSSVLGRAVYATEHEAIKALSYKEYKAKDGYAELWVPEDIVVKLPAEKSLFDRDGQKILSLKQRSIKKENIKYFFHAVGNKYAFINSAITQVAKK